MKSFEATSEINATPDRIWKLLGPSFAQFADGLKRQADQLD